MSDPYIELLCKQLNWNFLLEWFQSGWRNTANVTPASVVSVLMLDLGQTREQDSSAVYNSSPTEITSVGGYLSCKKES